MPVLVSVAERVTDFPLPPENMLSEQIVLADHRLALGLMHRDGAGLRVVAWDGERFRHMSRAAAIRFAREIDDGPYGKAMEPVVEALTLLAGRVQDIEAQLAARRDQRFADMPVEGHA